MAFGIDTPTLFAMVFGVLGPVLVTTKDPVLAWKVGMAVTIAIGLVPNGALFWPWAAPSAITPKVAGACGVLAALCWLAARRASARAV